MLRSCQGNQPSPWLTPHKPGRNITAVAVAAGVGRDIFVPDDQQSDVLALQLSMDRGPIRLGMAAVSPFASAIGVKRRLQFGVADPLRQRPRKPSALQTTQRLSNRRRREAETPRDLARRQAG